jgi:plastocyanin
MLAIRYVRLGIAAALASLLAVPSFGIGFAQEATIPQGAAVVSPADLALLETDPFAIAMSGNQFAVPELTVPAGATVTWLNLDPEDHDVVAADFVTFVSPIIRSGEMWQMTFPAPGMYVYLCDLHANMEAVVVVTEPLAGEVAPVSLGSPLAVEGGAEG